MEIKEIEQKKVWNGFVIKNAPGAFFQSWEWGDVEKENGNIVARYGIYDKPDRGKPGSLVGAAQTIQVRAKRGNYLHVRHGPVLKEWKRNYIRKLINFLREKAQRYKISFIRVSPLIQKGSKNLQDLGFRAAPIHNMDAEVTYIVSLNGTYEDILMRMRKNTRREIRRVEKIKELKLKSGIKTKQIQDFLALFKKTAQRGKFIFDRGIETEIKIFGKTNKAEVIVCYYKNKPIAGALISYWGNQGIYRYAASSELGKSLSAAYLVQWQAIKNTRARGFSYYNLWGGVADIRYAAHPWYGITVFKRGFSTKKIEYIHAQDLPLSNWYWKTYSIEKAIKYIRGYDTLFGIRIPSFLRRMFNV